MHHDLLGIFVIGILLGLINVCSKLFVTSTTNKVNRDPIDFIFFRCFVTFAVVLLIVSFFCRKNFIYTIQTFSKKDFLLCIVTSVILVITGYLTFDLIRRYSNTTIAPLNSCIGVFFAVIFSFFILNEKPSFLKIIGLFIMMFGFLIVIQGDNKLKSQLQLFS